MYKYKYKYLCKYAPMDEGRIQQTEDRWWEGERYFIQKIVERTTPDPDGCFSLPSQSNEWITARSPIRFRVYDKKTGITLPNIVFSMRQINKLYWPWLPAGSTVIDDLKTLSHGVKKNKPPNVIKSYLTCVGNVEHATGPFVVEIYDRWKNK
jgi:hypothetical protein